MNSNLEDSGIFLPAFSFRTISKLPDISATPKILKKVITNFDLAKASGPDCILMLFLNNWDSEFSYHASFTFQLVSERALFFIFLEDFIGGYCI